LRPRRLSQLHLRLSGKCLSCWQHCRTACRWQCRRAISGDYSQGSLKCCRSRTAIMRSLVVFTRLH
jgi:hypothetical protein